MGDKLEGYRWLLRSDGEAIVDTSFLITDIKSPTRRWEADPAAMQVRYRSP